MDTIFALASARGKSGIAVVRVSGPKAFETLELLGAEPVIPRRSSLRNLYSGDVFLDEALVTSFTGPNSFTGEDIVELGLHGSTATVQSVLSALGAISDFRIAEPGEFTRRALENEKLDLAQVEGLADLIEAETEAQRIQALRVFSGALGEKAQSWRERLIRCAALIEATIDFADEDVPVDVKPEVTALLAGVVIELRIESDGVQMAERVRDGFEVAIVGPPNVGKSTLLNSLAGREAAITSEIAGTTRDVIEVRMSLRGLPVIVLDTAGVRPTEDMIEALGVERARTRAEQSDLCVVLLENRGDTPSVRVRDGDIVLVAKSDIQDGDISARTGDGVRELIENIAQELENRASGAGVAIRERHRFAIERAVEALEVAQDRLDKSPELAELVAEELRTAIRALDSLVGRVDVEDLLDKIFSSFCIGK